MNRYAIFLALSLLMPAGAAAAESPSQQRAIIDTHVHYSLGVWDTFPPQAAIEILRELGIRRAWVSSTPDEGTQRLYETAPDFVVPVLRPYRHFDDRDTWAHDETIIDYLKQRLKEYRYAAIGEFHLEGDEAKSPVIREVVELAREHQLILHVHADARSVETLYKINPDAPILWAHAGFEEADEVKRMLDTYPSLWADLSFRREIYPQGRLLAPWRELLIKHADRFTLGTDTYVMRIWLFVDRALGWQRALLETLPDEVAARIASENAEALLRQSSWQ